jgi:fumarate reductase subunit D
VRPRTGTHRRDLLWAAALIHRVSGLALACFLPLHFLTLSLAIRGEAALEGALRWTASPAVRVGEAVLVFLLSVHLLGGLRVLVIENLDWDPSAGAPWRRHWHRRQRQLAAAAACLAALAAAGYLARAL